MAHRPVRRAAGGGDQEPQGGEPPASSGPGRRPEDVAGSDREDRDRPGLQGHQEPLQGPADRPGVGQGPLPQRAWSHGRRPRVTTHHGDAPGKEKVARASPRTSSTPRTSSSRCRPTPIRTSWKRQRRWRHYRTCRGCLRSSATHQEPDFDGMPQAVTILLDEISKASVRKPFCINDPRDGRSASLERTLRPPSQAIGGEVGPLIGSRAERRVSSVRCRRASAHLGPGLGIGRDRPCPGMAGSIERDDAPDALNAKHANNPPGSGDSRVSSSDVRLIEGADLRPGSGEGISAFPTFNAWA